MSPPQSQAKKKRRNPSLVADKREFPPLKRARKPQKPPQSKTKSSRRKTRVSAKKNRKGFLNRLIRYLIRGVFRIAAPLLSSLALLIGGWTIWDFSNLPEARALMDQRENSSITLLDHQGTVFAWRGDQFGGLVSAGTVSPHLKNAVIATEDKRFYRHIGISPRGILSAIRINLREGRHPFDGHGGSTITQQVAKRVFFSETGTITRKILEVPKSFAMELKYSKDEILTIYLNRAYLGSGSYGFEAAAQKYFGKSARQVNIAEAAMLAGLLKAPSRYAPTRDLQRARNRANVIIGLLEAQNYVTPTEAAEARARPAELSSLAARKAGGYFADWILETAPNFLINDARTDLVVKTTFDPGIQKAVEEGVKDIFENKVSPQSKAQVAVVVMSPHGAVRAMLGGRAEVTAGGFNRATQAYRQTGSAFKPFVYAGALEAGWGGNNLIEDAPFAIKIPNQPDYAPQNYDKEFRGIITLTDAFAGSINTVAVKLSEFSGRTRVQKIAKELGITSDIANGPAMALGSSESRLIDMTSAYAGILNLGYARRAYGLETIYIQGESAPLFEFGALPIEPAISEATARELIAMMHQVVERGTGQRAKIPGWEIAGKTGTTQAARDAWFIGFTADYVVGVWMGNDDNVPLRGVTGGGLPAEIWAAIVGRILGDQTPTPLPMQPIQSNSEFDSFVSADPNSIEAAIARDLADQETDAIGFFRRLFGLRGN